MKAHGVPGWFVMMLVCLATAAPSPGAPPWTTPLTRQALASGFKATLPPHLAVVLGLASTGESVEVKQLVSRAEQQVHSYNLKLGAPRELVLFSVDEHAGMTVAYLLTPAGKLRKAVSYHTGGEPRELPAAEARAGLAREIHYWSTHATAAAPNPASAPPPASPAAH